ncbi:MAG TPA: hypothetical protein VFE60_09220 [Roseiarcus sp.]|nr:hypothetical protein [Roseiarcus sp.]
MIDPLFNADLAVPLALTGHEAEAREALQHYLALPSTGQLRTIAGWKAWSARELNSNPDPRVLDYFDRYYDGLRKAGMPEG